MKAVKVETDCWGLLENNNFCGSKKIQNVKIFVSKKEKRRRKESLKELSDKELVVFAKSGERDAFGEIASRYQTKVFSLALKITKNAQDSHEVVQDVFLNVLAKLVSFKGNSAFSSWLYRITMNCALMLLRSRKKEAHDSWEAMAGNGESKKIFGSSDWSVRADRIFERKEILQVLDLELKDLPRRYRNILLLKELDGLSNREIGVVLSLTVAAVKSRLHRARVLFRERILSRQDIIDFPF